MTDSDLFASPNAGTGARTAPAVLFVDDEPNVLSGLRRMLRPRATEWDMAFATGGAEALRLIDARPFDAVVADMRMPQMDGAELLTAVGRRRPEAIRIILSGQSDKEGALRSVGPSHVFLSKPCEPKLLIETLERALRLRRMIFDPAVRRALGGLRALPSLPPSYHAISQAVESPHCSSHAIGDLIARDPAVTAALLHAANSAYFAPRRQTASIHQAVQYLGMDVVRAVVLSTGAFNELAKQIRDPALLQTVWEHSLRVAVRAGAALSAFTGRSDPHAGAEAYTAGLLHDVGVAALAASFADDPKRFAAIQTLPGCERTRMERTAFGADHGVVGGFLMGIWGLPDSIVEAIAFHHDPAACFAAPSALPRAVAVADAVDNLAPGATCDRDVLVRYVACCDLPSGMMNDPTFVAAVKAAFEAVKEETPQK